MPDLDSAALPFLTVIAAVPEDAGLLAIFADWLEERGDDRAGHGC